MRLTKITLTGFKSFADQTEFLFDQAVTGIVGPNGCGKSNVVDAIKWVLGERSSKSLRGSEMADVIFAGSAGRKPMGMASVRLTFDNPVLPAGRNAPRNPRTQPADPHDDPHANTEANTDTDAGIVDPAAASRRGLPIDADVVEVERRLTRDGESEYLINGRQARLRDIRDLFLDTGVGADAYSIIEQGKVDAMLTASPMERRVIFEEAAGVAKYKQRRVEAQRKLERTEANLRVTKDQLEATERRLRLVKGQAAKARKHAELSAELRAWKLTNALVQYDELATRIDGLTSQQGALHAQREAAAAALAACEAQRAQAEELVRAHGRTLRDAEQRVMECEHRRDQARQRAAMLRSAQESAHKHAQAEADLVQSSAAELDAAASALADLRETLAEVAQASAEAERALEAAVADRARAAESLAAARREHDDASLAVQRIDRERLQLLGSVEAEDRKASAWREQIASFAARAAALLTEQHEHNAQRALIASRRDALQAQAEDLRAQIRDAEAQLAALGEDRAQAAARARELDQTHLKLASKHATLREWVESRAGYADAVRDILHRRDRGEPAFAGVIAPLADLVEIDPAADAPTRCLAETLLGDDAQGLVVRSMEDVPTPDALTGIAGRVLFLPLLATPPAATPKPGTMRRLFRLRPAQAGEHAGALERLLDRLLAGCDVGGGMPAEDDGVSRRIGPDGVEVDARGRVRVGAANAPGSSSAGLLSRRLEVAELARELEAVGATLATARAELRERDARAEELSAAASQLRARFAAAEREVLLTQSKAETIAAAAARLEREHAALTHESGALSQRVGVVEADRAALFDRAQSLGRLLEERQEAARRLGASLDEHQRAHDEAGERANAARVELTRRTQELASARRELAAAEARKDDLSRRHEDAVRRLAAHREQAAEQTLAAHLAGDEAREAAAHAEELARVVGEARLAFDSATAAAGTASAQLPALRQRAALLDRDFHALEVTRRELEVKRENIIELVSNDTAIDLAAEHAQYRELLASGGVAAPLLRECKAMIDELSRAVRELGNVNMDAIDEEQNLQEQNQTLVRNVADIDHARAQLLDLIARLNDASRQRFGEVFATIQKQFGGEAGMFRKLFGGGKAELRLMPLVKEVEQPDGAIKKIDTGEIDLLESGVEVIAKPPGKEPRSITQLSGGEKTLTAVALLMSIFRSKPSCFCVLDEVDAALDEGNVGRFNAVVREFTDLSRFILITHNKRTMQNADRLYGVTMQERGVSTRVSVRFDQVGKDGAIANAHAQPPTVEVLRPRGAPGEAEQPRAVSPALRRLRDSDAEPLTARRT